MKSEDIKKIKQMWEELKKVDPGLLFLPNAKCIIINEDYVEEDKI